MDGKQKSLILHGSNNWDVSKSPKSMVRTYHDQIHGSIMLSLSQTQGWECIEVWCSLVQLDSYDSAIEPEVWFLKFAIISILHRFMSWELRPVTVVPSCNAHPASGTFLFSWSAIGRSEGHLGEMVKCGSWKRAPGRESFMFHSSVFRKWKLPLLHSNYSNTF